MQLYDDMNQVWLGRAWKHTEVQQPLEDCSQILGVIIVATDSVMVLFTDLLGTNIAHALGQQFHLGKNLLSKLY